MTVSAAFIGSLLSLRPYDLAAFGEPLRWIPETVPLCFTALE
jgi:hypothetical protein